MRLAAKTLEELVFAVPTDKLWKLITYKEQGLIKGNSEALKKVVQNGVFRERSILEEDPSFKQLITYAIIDFNESFCLFKRRSGQREKRLHNKFTLGAGGHMNPGISEDQGEQYIIKELKRELFEEVRFLNGCLIEDLKFIGFINDDTIPVGRHHIGLAYKISVTNKNIVINETDKMTSVWIDKADLTEFYEGLETWSKILFDNYIK